MSNVYLLDVRVSDVYLLDVRRQENTAFRLLDGLAVSFVCL